MSFSTISTFSSLKFSSGISILYTFPNVDGSMCVYYTFNFSANNSIPNYYNIVNGKTIYDATIIGSGNINNTLPNYVVGNGALQLVNNSNTIATQYVQNTIPINTIPNNNCLSISIWFNPSLSNNGFTTLFDIIGNIGFKGIQIDLSGANTICYGYYDQLITNLFFNVDPSMSFYYPLSSATNNILPNYYNALNSSVVYDATIMGEASITNNSLQLSNTNNTATQYVRNNTPISIIGLDGITISVWFNASNLSENNMYTIFDMGGTVGKKGIQLDLSGTDTICSQLYW